MNQRSAPKNLHNCSLELKKWKFHQNCDVSEKHKSQIFLIRNDKKATYVDMNLIQFPSCFPCSENDAKFLFLGR